MNYQQAIDFWFGRINYETRSATTNDLKLERMRALLRQLGDPQNRLRIVHITGTKGKGSTCAMLEAVLRASGYRVGLFTSPHLVDVEERFQIQRQPISRAEFAQLMAEVAETVALLDRAAEYPPATFFEISTALAFLHFVRRRVDLAVIEVGLGGRFDSTNVCLPILAAITSVGMDHMAQLGPTLEAIAYQKAGILKRGVPCVLGPLDDGPAKVVRQVARELHVPLLEFATNDFRIQAAAESLSVSVLGQCYHGLQVNLLGRHQQMNAAVTVALAELLRRQGLSISYDAVARGLATVAWPARVECVQKEPFAVILDSAHNVPSVEALIDALRFEFPNVCGPRVVVFAVSSDKQYPEMLASLATYFDQFMLTVYTSNSRRVSSTRLAEVLRQVAPRVAYTEYDDATAAYHAAKAHVAAGGILVVCGSVFLAGELSATILNDLGKALP